MVGPKLDGEMIGDLVQPAAKIILVADGSCVAREHQKCGLEHVLCIMLVVEDAAANTIDERPVSLYQAGKGLLIVLRGEAPEQLVVALRLALARCIHLPEVTQGIPKWPFLHAQVSRGPTSPLSDKRPPGVRPAQVSSAISLEQGMCRLWQRPQGNP
ncbi:hypothetical protein AYO44_01100 [Planctomycetaceae bacterium SCGC AG-212-F19]|nr:hypothetical protein AYO44_01100 [Planctomycetaceae bacterium SCGC AG-212-F19]